MNGSSDIRQSRRDGIGGNVTERRPRHTPIIDSVQLFAGRKEVVIRHGGQVYRLRVTKNGKLILNK